MDSATMDSAIQDGAHDVVTVALHPCFLYLFSVVWFPRSGTAHTIVNPYYEAERVTVSATQEAGFTIVTSFVYAQATENV